MIEERSIHLMGTVIDLRIEHEQAIQITDEVVKRLIIWEHRFSANDPSSELMAINYQASIKPISVHPELFHLIKVGKRHSCEPDSHLNITVGPLVQTWRIGFQDAKVPNNETIQSLLPLIDPNQIELDETTHSVFLTQKGMMIDLGCLAKGYIADLMIDYLKSEQVTSALINLGGNIVTFGKNPKQVDSYWRIGIRHPKKERNESLIVLKVKNQSVVTSGIYERTLTDQGKTYHHIINPQTGYPMETNVVSLTIVSECSLDGEIWTTKLFGKPVDEIIQVVSHLPNVDALIITQTGEVFYTPDLETMIV